MVKESATKKRQEKLEDEIRKSVEFVVSEKPSIGPHRSFKQRGKKSHHWKNY